MKVGSDYDAFDDDQRNDMRTMDELRRKMEAAESRRTQWVDMANKPTRSFGQILAGYGNGGDNMIAKGNGDLATAISNSENRVPFAPGHDWLGAGNAAREAAAKRTQLAPAIRHANKVLNLEGPANRISEFIASWQHRFLGHGRHGSMAGAPSPVGASMVGNAWHNLSGGAYDQGDILSHGERRRFRNMAIANPNSGVHRMAGETANGDRQRAKAFEKEVARREAGQGSDNQLLGDISRNTAKSAKLTDILSGQ
jgi:hypothetical protein